MESAVPVWRSLKTRVTLTTLVIFIISLWSLSFYVSQMLRKDMETLLGDQQFSTVSFLATEINDGFDERIEALHTVAHTMGLLVTHASPHSDKFLKGLPLLQRLFNAGVLAYSHDGSLLAATESTDGTVPALDATTVAAVIAGGKPAIAGPASDPQLRAPLLHIVVPVHDAHGRIVGVLSGVTNLSEPSFLDVVSTNRYGLTGGYMLVAPQARLIVAASVRARAMTALPGPGVSPLVDDFVQGYQGSRIGVTPYGTEVLASARRIATPDWYIAAALPTQEAFSPIRAMQKRMLLATVVLTVVAGLLTWWLLKRLLEPVLSTARALATVRQERSALPPLPIVREDEIGSLITGFNRLLDTLAQREEALRIAAIAFECQEGMIVTDRNQVILRTNRSFTRIMGYTNDEVVGRTTTFMRSDRHPPSFYEEAWTTIRREGSWAAEVWHRRKNGEVFPQWLTCTAVRDDTGDITHFVITHTDITHLKEQEAERLRMEQAHRNALVREVHHRIKNNLQGIAGLLRQWAAKEPGLAEPMNQAISQVQGISVIYGLQGRADSQTVHVCELTAAICAEVQDLWHTPVQVQVPDDWVVRPVAACEAVPIALVINELVVNAVKHGGKDDRMVRVALQEGDRPDIVLVRIINRGRLPAEAGQARRGHSGLALIRALMPHHGAGLHIEQEEETVVTILELSPPVIAENAKDRA